MRDTFDFMSDDRGRRRFGEEAQSVKLIDLAMVFHHDTAGAILVSSDGEEANAVWLPKSEAEMARVGKSIIGHKRNGQAVSLPQVTVTCPVWLAEKKGLV